MRCLRFLLVLAAIASMSVCANAKIGTCDAVPAATLLLPCFEVDLGQGFDSGATRTTIMFINNASTASVLAQVSLWTDYGVPTAAFDVTLAGNAVFALNLRDVFAGLTVAGVDFSTRTTELIPAHTGEVSPTTGKVSGFNYGDSVARGYVLVNAMNQAGAGYPTQAGYFAAGGTGKASNQNVLWGDFIYLDPMNNFSEGDTLAHIEASGTDPLVTTSGNYTFYAAFVNGTAIDNREPLGAAWTTGFDIADSYQPPRLVYWRDSKSITSPVNPMTWPSWCPMNHTKFEMFDAAGTRHVPPPKYFFPLVCGRLDLRDTQIAVPFEQGWLLVDLNLATSSGLFGTSSQSWVSCIKSWEGRFSVGHGATMYLPARAGTKAAEPGSAGPKK